MSSICPYPGLRPFNEKESIYFKGREEHIDKIITQLQEKHFLMVTGASGDGKSSLIYAGLIPRARAGFFKAKFNNWIIADFRPERNPLKNLAKSLHKFLDTENQESTHKELSFGFSSLVKVYQDSPYYLNYEDAKYVNADFEEKLNLKNKAANLLILIDQFEELFTNTENFPGGKPSEEVVALNNLIVQTTKHCKENNIPIYIVCTMRSDYVGDCAALKNLPELIVYSQFFVPRLKRHEIHRAISEPAKLSDNKISNRLVERLINDLNDGQDQLPILQHALNRIWRMSQIDGADQMDLLHYAKCGGMSIEKLDKEDKIEFQEWIRKEPEYKSEILKNTSLTNVLNSHARELYYLTPDHFRKLNSQNYSNEEILQLLKKIFLSLTKINDNRAVRNRASVEELIQTFKKENSKEDIETIIHLYCHSSNTLLLPFHHSLDHAQKLSPHDTLDITHESLIRNWKDLLEWTHSENENMMVLEDFKKQSTLWKDSGKNKKYLLAEGPLNYFESWLEKFKPTTFSITKYDNRPLSYNEKLKQAEILLVDAEEFIRESKQALSRKRKFAIAVLSFVMMILIFFTSWALMERNKALEQTYIADLKSKEARKSKEVALNERETAEKAKEVAEKAKENALENEALALKSQQAAEKAEKQALENLKSAKLNAELARKEAERANQALNESEKSKQEAFKEKQNAEKQEKKATELSYLATAQNLAIKSSFRSDDPELQALMALQSYYFTKENKGETQDPIIYEAISNAKKNYLKNEFSLNASIEQRSITLSQNAKELITSDRMGTYYKFDISEPGKSNKKQIGKIEENEINFIEPVQNKSISVNPSGIISLWDIAEITNPKLIRKVKAHEGVARKMVYVNTPTPLLISAGKDSSITIIQYQDFKISHQIKINFFVKDIQIDESNKTGIILSESGDLYKISDNYSQISPLLQNENQRSIISCIKINPKRSEFICGYNDGKVRIFPLENIWKNQFEPIITYSEFKNKIEIIELSQSKNKLAISSSDKSIKIFDLKKPNLKPIQIKNNAGKARALLFTPEEDLWVSFSDRTLRFIECSSDKIAKILCQNLKRNFTEKEWRELVSSELPYQNTCTNPNSEN